MQIEIKDEAKLKAIKKEAEDFANSVISMDIEKNYKSIFDLKLENLKLQHGLSELNLQMMQREKKREKQHQDTVNQLKDQVKELVKLLNKKSTNRNNEYHDFEPDING